MPESTSPDKELEQFFADPKSQLFKKAVKATIAEHEEEARLKAEEEAKKKQPKGFLESLGF